MRIPELAGTHFEHWRMAPDFWWPENFHPTTDPYLVSPDNGEIRFDIPSFMMLQELRYSIDSPIRINSGYRSPLHNARVGGGARSMHKLLIAFDLSLHGHDRHVMEKLARKAGFTGIGRYASFIHVDRGPVRLWYGSEAARRHWQTPEIDLG